MFSERIIYTTSDMESFAKATAELSKVIQHLVSKIREVFLAIMSAFGYEPSE